MTLPDLIAEIETGPLADRLAPHWANVFQAPTEPRPLERERQGSWDVKTRRAGRLHPDAAFAIHKILTTGSPSRSDELGWGAWPYKAVMHAKLQQRNGG